jgi:ABC-2 type transport system permease protein
VTPLLLWHVVRHELRLLARGAAGPVALVLMGVAVAYAAWAGARWRDEQLTTLEQIRAQDEQTYATIRAQLDELALRGNPVPRLQLAGMAWYIAQPEGAVAPAPHLDPRRAEAAASEWVGARHAALPLAPFSALAVGQSDLHPYYTRVTIRTRPILVNSDEIENPVNLLSGRFDLAFVLTFCCPLLMLPLLYNIVSEDRDSGTLALVASEPVALDSIILGRLVIRTGAAWLVTVAASLATLAIGGALDRVSAADVAVWCVVVTAAVLFWAGVALVVNAARWRSATNATVLAVAWLVLVVILPVLLGEVAGAWAPVPSRVELINAVREAGNLDAADVAALVTAYYEDHPDAAPSRESADVTAIRGLAQQDEVDRRIEPILSAYRTATARQQTITDRLRFLSPPLLVYGAAIELAGTTNTRYRQFADQVDAYHARWRRYFYPLVHARASLTMREYEQAPRFTFEEEGVGGARRRALLLSGVAATIGLLLAGVGLQRSN